MKAAFAAMCIVLAAALGMCMLSMHVHERALGLMEPVCARAIAAVRADDGGEAARAVAEMDEIMQRCSGTLEMLASHNDLHDTMTCLRDAKVALECGDMDDAYQALARLQGMLEHLLEHERLTVENLL